MKTNKLLYTLLGGVLLASCSVDDGIDTNPVASINPNSPVFSVHFEDAKGTRVEWANGGLTFDKSDYLSLYHGGEIDATPSFTKYQNAIYGLLEEKEGDAALEFATQSLVYGGSAIMVYPADKEFFNELPGTKDVKVKVGEKGTIPQLGNPGATEEAVILRKEARKGIPYVSDFINVIGKDDGGWTANGQNMAGYGNKYDIALKPVAGTIKMKLKIDHADAFSEVAADGLTIDNVIIYATSKENLAEGEYYFGNEAKIVPNGDKHEYTTAVVNGVNRAQWEYGAMAEITEGANAIQTKDFIDDNSVAVFTLLPGVLNDEEVVNPDEDGVYDFSGDTDIKEATIVVTTSLGTVTLTPEEEVAKIGGKMFTPTVLMNRLLRGLVKEETNPNSLFFGEMKGVTREFELTIDMRNLEVGGSHIKSEKDLVNTAKLFGALAEDKSAGKTLYLDGDNAGEFVMNTTSIVADEKSGMDAYKALLAMGTKFVLCSEDDETCNKIVINNNGTGAKALSDELKFKTANVPVELQGDWTIGEVNCANVASLTIAEGATVDFEADVKAKDGTTAPKLINNGTINVAEETSWALETENKDGATINVKGYTTLKSNLTNKGIINLDNALELEGGSNDDSAIKLINDFEITEDGVKQFAGTYTLADLEKTEYIKRGVINFNAKSSLYVTNGTKASAENYGQMNVKASDVDILLAVNQKGTGLSDAISTENIMGVIDWGAYDMNKNTKLAEGKFGFNKTTKRDAERANYIVWSMQASDNGVIDLTACDDKIIQLNLTSKDTGVSIKGECKNLIIPEGTNKLTIEEGETLKVDQLYLKTILVQAGALERLTDSNTIKYKNYFGGADIDSKNVKIQ